MRDEAGVTAIEYGLIAALIAVAAIAAMKLVGTSLSTTFQTVADSL
jgi:pilus assembly protein Flp/PilA